MKLIQELKEEHNAIIIIIEVLEEMCKSLEMGEEVNPGDMERIIEFMKVFTDTCHHGKEELVLFPAMEKLGIGLEGGQISLILTEHDLGRNYVKDLEKSVKEYRQEVHESGLMVIAMAKNLTSLLSRHIDTENELLYPLADAHIPEAQQKELKKQFDSIEHDVVGEGKHEEYHRMLEKLQKIYLS